MTTDTAPRRRRWFRRKSVLIGMVLLIVLLGAGGLLLQRGTPTDAAELPPGWEVAIAEEGTIEATIDATGEVEPASEASLSFAVNGTVTAVLVTAGAFVEAGQPLARIDPVELELSLEKARADLAQEQADYAAIQEGVTPQEIAEAQARVSRAQSQYQQTASSVTQADIDAARAELEQAQAKLARLQSGPEEKDLVDARERVERARVALDSARTELASAKERARLDMETTANEVRNKQEEYSRIYWENRELENALARGGDELPQEDKDEEAAALRAVEDAEMTLEQQRVAYEEAQQEEITTLEERESDLREAQANLDDVLSGARTEDLAAARAEVRRAQAGLEELTGANRSSGLDADRAGIAEAQAQLEKLLVDPSVSEIAKAEAAIARAEVAVKEAERDIEQATMLAPFAATVSRVNLQVGERTDGPSAEGSSADIVISDLSSMHVDVPVDELDVAQIEVGQQVRVTLDALPDQELTGTVTNIAPTADKSDQGTTTYEVTVEIDMGDAPVRPGMTAVVEIVTVSKDDVVLVPRRAVQTENGQSYVLIPVEGEPTEPGMPASEQREVELGLSDRQFVEITDGLEAGEEILVQDVVQTFNPMER
ncbi:MAG: efflux RND transporter periplasmic adaptor subunit [Chloroflexaceae bacterium]